jgi:hypothetical protein
MVKCAVRCAFYFQGFLPIYLVAMTESLRVQWIYGITSSIHFDLVRFDVFTAVNMKNAVFWDIKTYFVLHRRHVTTPLQIPAG